MPEIVLSYVMTTYNKLPYLKVVLPDLLKNKMDDEEVIIVDGGSTDGTYEYLKPFHESGEIDILLSEKDKGEAHGFNKGILKSRGELIKIITDDDAYSFPVIEQCKNFMLDTPQIDVMGGNTGTLTFPFKNTLFVSEDFQNDFEIWRDGKLKNFFFNGTCLMLRKSSLGLTGLFNSSGLLTDMEYTLRITSIANLSWCNGIISVRILNSRSNYVVFQSRADEESKRLCNYYNYKYPWDRKKEFNFRKKIKGKIRKMIQTLKRMKVTVIGRKDSNSGIPFENFREAYTECNFWMDDINSKQGIRFLMKDKY